MITAPGVPPKLTELDVWHRILQNYTIFGEFLWEMDYGLFAAMHENYNSLEQEKTERDLSQVAGFFQHSSHTLLTFMFLR